MKSYLLTKKKKKIENFQGERIEPLGRNPF